MRALFFDHPADPAIWDYPAQFLLGDDLLVHPVTSPGAASWTTYLPARSAGWVDVWSGEHLAGGGAGHSCGSSGRRPGLLPGGGLARACKDLRVSHPRDHFELFSSRLRDSLASRDDVIGLVWMGSAAARHRVDEWSDHDFALVTADGAEETYRTDLSWLPDFASVALAAREAHGGVKVIYDDGHVLEFGVTSLDGLSVWHANVYEVALDRGGVAEAFVRVAGREKPNDAAQFDREIGLFVALLLIGVGRFRRGEVLVASQLVRTIAVGHLVTAWRLAQPTPRLADLDDLDPFRRFELVYPEAGKAIAEAIERDVESAGRALLELAEAAFGDRADFPVRGVAAVRSRLGW
jgi:hypothetical protein